MVAASLRTAGTDVREQVITYETGTSDRDVAEGFLQRCAFDDTAVIENVVSRGDDEIILQMVKQADKTGIDCPFGWPEAFVEFVAGLHGPRAGYAPVTRHLR
jgi:hypothetical protein